jgi:hypothetical protein
VRLARAAWEVWRGETLQKGIALLGHVLLWRRQRVQFTVSRQGRSVRTILLSVRGTEGM